MWQRECVYKLSTMGNEGGEFEFPLGALLAITWFFYPVAQYGRKKESWVQKAKNASISENLHFRIPNRIWTLEISISLSK